MINYNFNYIESSLKRPGPITSNTVYYMVVGGGAGGEYSNAYTGNSGLGGFFQTGSVDVEHTTTIDFQIGKGGNGGGGTGGSPIAPTNGETSSLSYSPASLSVAAPGGYINVASCPVDPSYGTIGCNGKGGWEMDLPTYSEYAFTGGSQDGAANGYGGGRNTPTYTAYSYPFTHYNWGSNTTTDGYNFTGAGGGAHSRVGTPTPGSGDGGGFGGYGLVALAFLDPNEKIDVNITLPSRDGLLEPVSPYLYRTYNGYRIWYFFRANGAGSFQVLGNKN